MGYYSQFKISAEPDFEQFGELLQEYSHGYHFDWWDETWNASDVKWYKADEDIKRLSEDYPHIVIHFQRIGEEFPDGEKYDIKAGAQMGDRKVLGWVGE